MTPIYIMIDQEETGRNILDLMHRQGLKVRDIQEACGFEQPQAVYKWIHGQSLPSIDNLLILAKLFGSTVEGILATSGDAFPHFNKELEAPMEEINYYQLDHLSLFYDMYMFIDTAEHLADQVFIQHKLPIRFKGDYQKDGQKYRMILCKAPKKRRADFVECMKDLARKMLLLGNTDYCDFCSQVQDQVFRHLQRKVPAQADAMGQAKTPISLPE